MDYMVGRPFDIKRLFSADNRTLVHSVLSLPPENRSRLQLEQLAKALESNAFLSRFSGSDQLIDLCKEMRLRSYAPQEVVFKEGDPGDCFYIVHIGRVGIFKQLQECKRKLREMGQGQSFGEIALVTGETRTAEVLALVHTVLIELDKDCFDRIIKNNSELHTRNVRKFFRKLQVFKHFPPGCADAFAAMAYLRKFPANSTVLCQGETPSGIYFVAKGSVQAVRRVYYEKSSSFSQTRANLSRYIVMDTLEQGEAFGHYAFFHKEPLDHSILTSLPLETYYIDKAELLRLNSDILDDLRAQSKPYPPDSVLKKGFQEHRRWSKFKQSLCFNIRLQNQFERKSLDFRHPLPTPKREPPVLFRRATSKQFATFS